MGMDSVLRGAGAGWRIIITTIRTYNLQSTIITFRSRLGQVVIVPSIVLHAHLPPPSSLFMPLPCPPVEQRDCECSSDFFGSSSSAGG
jgi:hypothetical protein